MPRQAFDNISSTSIKLSDGRDIGVSKFGAVDGPNTLFYFHGFPGSRLEASIANDCAKELGISVFALDRPGFGLSHPSPGRNLEDWTKDVTQVADLLKIEKFSVLGVSGGAPFALACAAYISERVGVTALVSGLAEFSRASSHKMVLYNRLLLGLGKRWPKVGECLLRIMAQAMRYFPAAYLSLLKAASPEVDRCILEIPSVASMFSANFREATRSGLAGMLEDYRIFCQPWNIELEKISGKCLLWHGESDHHVPVEMGQSHAKRLPNCKATILPGQGHFMVIPKIAEILNDIVNTPTKG